MTVEMLATFTHFLTEEASDERHTQYMRRKARERLALHLESCLKLPATER